MSIIKIKNKELITNLVKDTNDKIAKLNHLLLDFEYYENDATNGKTSYIPNIHIRLRELNSDSFFKELIALLFGNDGIIKLLNELFQKYKNKDLSIKDLAKQVFVEKEIPPAHSLKVILYVLKSFRNMIDIQSISLKDREDFYKANPVFISYIFLLRKILEDVSLSLVSLKEVTDKQIPYAISRKYLSADESFDLCLHFLGNEHNFYLNNEGISPLLSVFFLRQSTEIKIFETLGINSILDKNGNIKKYSGDKILSLLDDFENNVILPKDIDKELILKINKWCNLFVHFGVSYEFYLNYFAYLILKDLFNCRLFVRKSYYLEMENILAKAIANNEEITLVRKNYNDAILNNFLLDDYSFEKTKECLKKISYENFKKFEGEYFIGKTGCHDLDPNYHIFIEFINDLKNQS